MVKLGIIGFSKGNGHPFSFSSILNGFNEDEYKKTEWLGILNYLKKRNPNEISSLSARVTHVWTQDIKLSKQIALCSNIPNITENLLDMIGSIDGLIIARDDYESHKEIAEPFLVNNIPVFIDKPLTIKKEELDWYKSFYDKGLLLSTSGLRYCIELDEIRNNIESLGDIRKIQCAVVNNWEKYGIHMLDATLEIFKQKPKGIFCIKNEKFESYLIYLENNVICQIDCMGEGIFSFDYTLYGTKEIYKTELRDNFSAFKRTLENFILQINTKKPSISWESMSSSILTLIAGIESRNKNKKIIISE
jgi:predicted dehydrogenase